VPFSCPNPQNVTTFDGGLFHSYKKTGRSYKKTGHSYKKQEFDWNYQKMDELYGLICIIF
jgi:hypothetical protein